MLDLRRRWQRVMEAEVSREIEELTGRKVIGFMSDNHIDPDLAVEVFVLEPLATSRPGDDSWLRGLCEPVSTLTWLSRVALAANPASGVDPTPARPDVQDGSALDQRRTDRTGATCPTQSCAATIRTGDDRRPAPRRRHRCRRLSRRRLA